MKHDVLEPTVDRIVAGVRAEPWETIPGPGHLETSEASRVLEGLLRVSGRESSQASYSRVLSLAGNNHAGSLYPRAPVVLTWVIRIARAVGGWPRATALEILIDACCFEPDPTWGVVSPLPVDQVRAAGDWLRAVVEADGEFEDIRVAALELIEAVSVETAVEVAGQLSARAVSGRRLGSRDEDVGLAATAKRVLLEASRADSPAPEAGSE